MTTKILSGIYTATYNLAAPVTTLSITASGYVFGGVAASGTGKYTIANAGAIVGQTYGVGLAGRGVVTNTGVIETTSTTSGAGIFLAGGGSVTNSGGPDARISGYDGVAITGQNGAVTNGGTIVGTGLYGVDLAVGGKVTNGAAGTAGALIEGEAAAIFLGARGSVLNYGSVLATGTSGAGVYLALGGSVTNAAGGLIESYAFTVGLLKGSGTVFNDGVIRSLGTGGAGVAIFYGGAVTNGDDSHQQALIEGAVGVGAVMAASTVNNFGTILSTAAPGLGSVVGAVFMIDGGAVTNGDSADTAALIEGPLCVGIAGAAGTLANFGTIGGAASSTGVVFGSGGVVTNGSASDTTALVQAFFGVEVNGAAGTVGNFGTIEAFGTTGTSAAVYLAAGGLVTNGAAGRIQGFIGVYDKTTTASVTNAGTIIGRFAGILLEDGGGPITNGSVKGPTALIQGRYVGAATASGDINNFGTIRGAVVGGAGAYLRNGTLTNGGVGDTTALISGRYGVQAAASVTVINDGTISGSNSPGSTLQSLGVGLGGGVMINQAGALVIGYYGVGAGAGGVLSNYGTIEGTSGKAVMLSDPTAQLNAEGGSVILGQVMAGSASVAAVSGATTMSGLLTGGQVVGAGTLTLNGGASEFVSGTSLTVAAIAVAGAATTVEIDTGLTFANTWAQSGGTLNVSAGYAMTFTGAGDSFSGTVTGAGAVAFSGGSDTFDNLTLSAAAAALSKGAVTLQDTITLPGALTATGSKLTVAAAGATLTGGGTLALSGSSNIVKGATAASTLTLADVTLSGSGALGGGKMTLVNQAGGTIEGVGGAALTIDTGSNKITNAGVVESTGAGGVTIASAVVDTGQLEAVKGDLTVNGAVSGGGSAVINAATLTFASTVSEAVTFSGTKGELVLAKSQTYTGAISGFSKTGGTSLDLRDIGFVSASEATFSGTAKGGVLSVTDGTHTAKISLSGNYTASTFVASSDGHGGTLVVDPPAGKASPAAFAAAMAGVGSSGGQGLEARSPIADRMTMLVRPHTSAA